MPELIEHIDAIARKIGRAALYLECQPERQADQRAYRLENDPGPGGALAWLGAHGVARAPCQPFADPAVMASYRGKAYLELAYDDSLPAYCALRDPVVRPDGDGRQAGMRFYAMPLHAVMRVVEHDAPGYWQRWAEIF